MLYCWIEVVIDTFTTGSVSGMDLRIGLCRRSGTNRFPFRIMSPLFRFTRPSTTGSAAVPRNCRFAVPPRLSVRLVRFTLLVESTVLR